LLTLPKNCLYPNQPLTGHASVNERKGIPIVFLNRICDGMDVSKLIVDDFDSAYCTTEYLIKCKRKCPPWQPVVVEDIGSEVHRQIQGR
jgi:hypothetical protein